MQSGLSEDKATEILSQLISLPTVNPMERASPSIRAGVPVLHAPVERPVTDYLQELFRPFDVQLSREPCSDIHENLLIRVRGETEAQATLFESHVDTVPADDWLDLAFEPRVSDGYVYGRGACDDKGSLAAMVLAVLQMLESGTPPPQTVLLLAAGDEECGQTGIKHFAKTYSDPVGRGVFGEPTSCMPIVQHKGCVRWDITVRGRSSHSAEPEKGRNAIYDMLHVIERLRELQTELIEAHSSSFISPPTLTVTMINGGQTRNALPAECRCGVDLRVVPEMDRSEVSRQVIDSVNALGLDVVHGPFQCFSPPLSTPLDDPFAVSVSDFCRDELSMEIRMGSAPYGSDASWMPQGGPAVVLGPGNIEHAHAIDECVEVQQVVACARIYQRIMTQDWSI